MQDRPKVIAFDVDPDSLASLRQAFPECEVEATNGATPGSLEHDWSPGAGLRAFRPLPGTPLGSHALSRRPAASGRQVGAGVAWRAWWPACKAATGRVATRLLSTRLSREMPGGMTEARRSAGGEASEGKGVPRWS